MTTLHRYLFVHFSLLIMSAYLMKFTSIFRGKKIISTKRFLGSPVMSILSFQKARPVTLHYFKKKLFHWILIFLTFITFYIFTSWFLKTDTSFLLKSYSCIPATYLWLEFLSITLQLLYSPSGFIYPGLHAHPLMSRNLTEFWGRRWNVWFGDWFKETIFQPLKRKPLLAMGSVFLFSGLWHEILFTLPFTLIFKNFQLGLMFLFFGSQFLGVLLDQKVLKHLPAFPRWIIGWSLLILPIPLYLNQALLPFFTLI